MAILLATKKKNDSDGQSNNAWIKILFLQKWKITKGFLDLHDLPKVMLS